MLIGDLYQPLQQFESRSALLAPLQSKTCTAGQCVQVQQMGLAWKAGQPCLTFYESYGLRMIGSYYHSYSVRKSLAQPGSGLQNGFTFRSMVQYEVCVL